MRHPAGTAPDVRRRAYKRSNTRRSVPDVNRHADASRRFGDAHAHSDTGVYSGDYANDASHANNCRRNGGADSDPRATTHPHTNTIGHPNGDSDPRARAHFHTAANGDGRDGDAHGYAKPR